MTDRPLVSVGLPVYNGASRIGRVLEGLLNDAYKNLEILISDNASTDETERICKEYALKDGRIQYYRSDINRGSFWNGDRVLKLSKGKYFLWASHHDERDKTYIEKCVDVMDRDDSVVMCYSRAVWLEDGNRITGPVPKTFDTRGMTLPHRFLKTIWSIGYCYQMYGVFRRDSLMECLFLTPRLAPDHLLIAELSLSGAFACIPEVLFYVWRDADSQSIHKYFERHKLRLTPRSALAGIGEMVSGHVKVVRSHIADPLMRIALIPSVVICIMLRYPGLFFGVFFSSLFGRDFRMRHE